MVVRVIVVPVNGVDVGVVGEAAGLAGEALGDGFRVMVSPSGLVIPLLLYNFERRQYNAVLVSEYIASRFSKIVEPGGILVVGVVEGDGYVEGLNFVFGLASKKLGVASVYTFRLYHGLGSVVERIAKVIAHEVGHLLSLGHCRNHCVMRFSNSLEELDSKPLRFCPECRRRLERVVYSDVDDEG